MSNKNKGTNTQATSARKEFEALSVANVEEVVTKITPELPKRGLVSFGIAGAGNGGCQVAQKAFLEKGFDAIAFNTSLKDMLNVTAPIPKIVIGDERGVGKDREVAIEYIYSNHKKITSRDEVANFIKNNEVIAVINTAGGGSGSGMGFPLLNVLMAKAKELGILSSRRFILIHILPQLKEGYLSQKNTMSYFSDIPKGFMVPMMSYDNEAYSHLSPAEVLEKVNEDIVKDLCVLRGDYVKQTPYESVDEEDLFRVYEAPGRIVVLRAENIKEKDIDKEAISDMLIKNHYNDATTEIQKDGIVKYSAVIANLNDKMASKFNIYSPVSDLINTSNIKSFPHVYRPKAEEENSVFVILSGLSRPTDRAAKIAEVIAEIEAEEASKSTDDGFDAIIQRAAGIENNSTERVTVQEIDDVEAMFSRLRRGKN